MDVVKIRQALTIAGLCLFGLWCVAVDATAVEPSNGRQILLNRGLQIQALSLMNSDAYPAALLWNTTNFTTYNSWYVQNPQGLLPLPAGTPWARWYNPTTYVNPGTSWQLSVAEYANRGSLVSLQYGDEPGIGINDPPSLNQTVLDDMEAKYAHWHAYYPGTLAYTNFAGNVSAVVNWLYGAPYTVDNLTDYMNHTNPDMLMFDYYPSFSFGATARSTWYKVMQRYRTAALAGNDLSGQQPIPYAQYLNLYRNSYSDPLPSESFVRLQQFASWAFGYTAVSAFVYNGSGSDLCSTMFDAAGAKTPVFDYVAETNRQSRNLGPALVRLVSADIRMIKGTDQSSLPTDISAWTPGDQNTGGYTDYITAITPITGQGGAASASYSDVLVGYLKPLLDSNPACTFVNGLHFMIVNGGANGALDALKQWYRVNFNFGSSGYNALAKLDRNTGQVVPITLTSDGGSLYHYDFSLEGGTGDLFCFWNSNTPLPTIPEPGAMSLLTTGILAMLVYACRRKNIQPARN